MFLDDTMYTLSYSTWIYVMYFLRLKSTGEKATGGGAYKYTDNFKRLGIILDKEDEMDCLVAGAKFLLKMGV